MALAADPPRAADATRALEAALLASPGRSDLALSLATLYLNAGRFGEAEALLVRVQRTDRRPEVTAAADARLAAVRSRRAVDRFDAGLKQLAAGRRDEALRTMQEAVEATDDPQLRVELTRQLEQVRSGGDAARAPGGPGSAGPDARAASPAGSAEAGSPRPPESAGDRHAQLVKRYNEAVAKANAGNLAGALPIMKEVEAQAAAAADQEVLANAQRLVKKWSGKLKGRK